MNPLLHKQSKMSKTICASLLLALILATPVFTSASDAPKNTEPETETSIDNVTGTVTDDAGEPLPGVTVKIKGTTTATTTDINGVFRINLPTGDETLIFSFIGFKSQEVAVSGRTNFRVALQKDAQSLKEVVINVGYGTKRRDDVVGSVAGIKAEEIEDLPVPNIAAALRNRVAGVGVSTASGKPGSAVSINIRNSPVSETASFRAGSTSEPLYIIDGLIASRNDFDVLDPTTVENISFLKDASAAIYGAAGAKGVVLITTKKGKPGKPKITYAGYLGVSDAASRPEMLSAFEHASMLNNGFRIANQSSGNLFSDAELESLKGNSYKGWFDQLWQPSAMHRHTLNVSGGSEAITFFAGGNFYDEGGNYGGIKYNKFGFRSGMNAKIIEGLTSTVTFSTDFSNRNTQTYSNSDNDQSFFQQLVTTPYWIPMEIDGRPVNFAGRNNNPYAVMQSDNYIRNKNQGLGVNASVEYKPKFLSGLSARVQYGLTNRSGNGRQYTPAMTLYNFVATGQNSQLISNQVASEYKNTNSSLLTSSAATRSHQFVASLGYEKTIGKHNVDWLVATDISRNSTEDLAVKWNNQLLAGVDERWAFDPSTFVLHSDNVFEAGKVSYLSRLNYNFGRKYFLEGIVRFDASSNFATENRWGMFPSLGLGWNVSDQEFFSAALPVVNYLKLRANYGLVGDDRVQGRLWQARYEAIVDGYLYNENQTSGLRPGIMPNRNITWEKALNLNLGLDAAFFNNKVNLTVDFFRRRNYDMFDKGNNENFPMYAGFEAPILNYQEASSWGTEFSIGYQNKLSKNWGINSNVNFGFSNSRIDRMFYNENQLWDQTYPDLKYQFGTNPRRYNSENYGLITKGMFRSQSEVDAFLNQYPTYTIDGRVPQVGWLYYEDASGDGRITEKDQVLMFDRTSPWLTLGFNLGVSYKSLSLSSNLVARLGGKDFYDSKSREEASFTTNVPTYWRDHWTPENSDAKFPRFDDAGVRAGWNSTFWAVDGTMLRVNNMTLSYKFPKNLLSRIGLSDVRAIVTGNNLWTLRNPLPFKDPYSNTIYDYPTLRTISLGLNVGI